MTLPCPWPRQRTEQQPTHPRLLNSRGILVGVVTNATMDSVLNSDKTCIQIFPFAHTINVMQTYSYHNLYVLCASYYLL